MSKSADRRWIVVQVYRTHLGTELTKMVSNGAVTFAVAKDIKNVLTRRDESGLGVYTIKSV